ncbi:ferredoxin [Amycolatopsis sp. 195334CR]|uniref:ferredoxin n=1 Tax=Amycolatopsis sp. 195334CR TaxID=2814588 RepID=UPI001A8D6D13|nr:ferredoxin [Amycolatopsis sp. 195334CR]MBN6036532.1 ferredoxin [Amycolatopsis sp. 195334CR]
MRISTDVDRCVGAGQCVLAEPEVFDQNEEDGTVVLLTDEVSGETADRVREATYICPAQALSISD